MLRLLVGRRLDLDGSFEVAARRAAARVEGDEAREDESRHGADGRRDDQAGVVAAAGRLLLGRAARGALGQRVALSLLSFQMASSSFPVKFCAHIHKNLGFQAMSEFAGRLSSRRR